MTSDADLGNFLSRPQKILSIDWNVGSTIAINFNPWASFYEDPIIGDKLKNFALLRSKLKLKFVLNGNSFYYGKVNVSYLPLQDSDVYDPPAVDTEINNMIIETQRPKIMLDATTSTGGEMVLPFFFQKNWMSIPGSDWETMGRVTLRSFQQLRHANNSTKQITISVFAYATDVEMCLPTQYVPVSQELPRYKPVADEYCEDGVVSKPASTIAKVANALAVVPSIAPYARATEIGANTVSTIARLFGFSRPAILHNIMPYMPYYAGINAPTDADDPVAKLTTDSKQELTIDPRTVGLSNIDELSIAHLATKESYLTQFEWPVTRAEGSLLFNSQITPRLFATRTSQIYMTSMGLTSLPFRFWRGTVKFRFQVVRPVYYKGRMRITWDPAGVPDDSNFNNAYSKVVDITDDDDTVVTVGWGSTRPYLRMKPLDDQEDLLFGSTAIIPGEYDLEETNGLLSVSVVTELSTPSDSEQDISINVFVSAHDDLQYARPTEEEMRRISYYAPVSKDIDMKNEAVDAEGESSEYAAGSGYKSDDMSKIFFGEKDVSFRALLKRYQLYTAYKQEGIDATNLNFWVVRDSVFPRLRGFATNSPTTSGVGTPYNYTTTGILSLLLPCYAGVRGSIRCCDNVAGVTFNRSGLSQVRAIAGEYETADIPKINQVVLITGSATQPGPLSAQDTLAGTFITPMSQQPVLRYENPYYNNRRFSHSRSLSYGNATEYAAQLDANTANGVVELVRYICTGEDFNLFFYCGPPIMYLYDDPS